MFCIRWCTIVSNKNYYSITFLLLLTVCIKLYQLRKIYFRSVCVPNQPSESDIKWVILLFSERKHWRFNMCFFTLLMFVCMKLLFLSKSFNMIFNWWTCILLFWNWFVRKLFNKILIIYYSTVIWLLYLRSNDSVLDV